MNKMGKKTIVECDEVFFSREHVFDSVLSCFFTVFKNDSYVP
jgi:hypothetical protein